VVIKRQFHSRIQVRHHEVVWHPGLKVPDDCCFGSRYRDRKRLACGCPKLDDVGASLFSPKIIIRLCLVTDHNARPTTAAFTNYST